MSTTPPCLAPADVKGESSKAVGGVAHDRPEPAPKDQQIQFLYKVLDDNQGIIRFLDAKAAFAIALLSAMMGKILADLADYFPLSGHSPSVTLLLILFWSFALLCAFIVFRVIFPVTNPAENVRLAGDHNPQFFLWEMQPKSWVRIFSTSPRFSRLALEQESFIKDISFGSSQSLIACLSGEALKVSYIRQIKADRLRALGCFLPLCSLLFILLVAAQNLTPKIPASKNTAPMVDVSKDTSQPRRYIRYF
jgi:hypothetical protein